MLLSDNKYNVDIATRKGVGDKRKKHLNRIGIQTVSDLLFYFPRIYINRGDIIKISSAQPDEEGMFFGEVRMVNFHLLKGKKGIRNIFSAILEDDTGSLIISWFNSPFLKQTIFKGTKLIVFGNVISYRNHLQITSPEFYKIVSSDDEIHNIKKGIIPIYPESENINSRFILSIVEPIISNNNFLLEETLPDKILTQHKFPDRTNAIKTLHLPEKVSSVTKAKERFIFEEFFYEQLYLNKIRAEIKKILKKRPYLPKANLARDLYKSLPFELTNAQKRVLSEIVSDLKSPNPMNRLLQGDVGSGKTVVALLSAVYAIESGYQVAFMVPTEILAYQHYTNIMEILQNIVGTEQCSVPTKIPLLRGVRGMYSLGVKPAIEYLIGSTPIAKKKLIYAGLENGELSFVIGTHALFQEKVNFKNLGLAIVDEQHRFGVMQRARLESKGLNPDVLFMTATPIPRSLAMTIYGDMDVSIIDELPKGRGKMVTRLVGEEKRDDVYKFVLSEIQQGVQAYIVCPLVEQSETLDLKSAIEFYEKLKETYFKNIHVGLMHGRLKSEEKEDMMKRFKAGEIDALVSTTVIEVGVDVPNATIMVVEHSNRFGLSQLHQLRGRISRGQRRGVFVMMSDKKLSPDTYKRLKVLVETTDGFKIAEEDLKFRGPGEIFGLAQSGFPAYHLADVIENFNILQSARNEAQKILPTTFLIVGLECGSLLPHSDSNHIEPKDNLLIKKYLIIFAENCKTPIPLK